jgi:LPXTG-site transpeptidase (sortase) family protein
MKTKTKMGLVGVIGGLALALVAWLLYPTITTGSPQAIEESLNTPAPAPTTTEADDQGQSPPTTSEPERPVWQDSIVDSTLGVATERRTPVHLRVDRLSIDAPIRPYGVNSRTGQMDIPRNVSEVAWYKYGPTPGESGSAVLAAHVDLSDQGRGVFFDLKALEPGDQIWVTYDDGDTVGFKVEARTVYSKQDLPVDAIFSRSGPAILTLVTCGGGFSDSSRSYDSNVVVYASPISESNPDFPTVIN